MKHLILSVTGFFLMTTAVFAGHPLITDDTNTQGRGKGQVEIGIAFFYDKDQVDDLMTIKSEGGEAAIGLTVGLFETLDIVVGLPYAWYGLEENGIRVDRADGISGITFAVKWRFFEKDGWSVAVKPGISLPTGDEDRSLGRDAPPTACS